MKVPSIKASNTKSLNAGREVRNAVTTGVVTTSSALWFAGKFITTNAFEFMSGIVMPAPAIKTMVDKDMKKAVAVRKARSAKV